MKACKTCIYNNFGYCSKIEIHDPNDKTGDYACIETFALDDSGLDVSLKVSDSFGCVMHKERSGNGGEQ